MTSSQCRLEGASVGSVPVAPKPGRVGTPGKTPPPLSDPRQEPEGPEEEPSGKEELLGEEEPQQPPRRLQERRAQVKLKPGQLETGTAEFLHRQKELSSRRCYLRNFWYAAGEAALLVIPKQFQDCPVSRPQTGQFQGDAVQAPPTERGKLNCTRLASGCVQFLAFRCLPSSPHVCCCICRYI